MIKKVSYNIIVREEDVDALVKSIDNFVANGEIEIYVLLSDVADLTEEERNLVEKEYPDILIND